MRFAGFIGPSYTSQSVNVDCQRCVNLFPEINALGTGKEREVASLVPTPGLRLLVTLPESPVRGLWCASNGELYAVGGSKFYSLDSNFAATERGSLNSSSGYVSMADNGTYVVFVDGTDGYTWNMSTDTYAEITDPDWPGADLVTYQDGYFIFNEPESQNWFISGINDITIDPLDFAPAEGNPDNVVGVISANQNVYVFGDKSLEVFYNSGDADFPFTRIQGAVVDIGCSAPFSIAKISGLVFFLGGDANGTGIIYQSEGYHPRRISTSSIEAVIKDMSAENIASSKGWTYQKGGHVFYCLNLTGTRSTWVYDATTQFWHERTYTDLWFLDRHRADNHSVAYGISVVGDYSNGNIYELDPDTYYDEVTDGVHTAIARIRTAPHLTKGLKFVRHNSFELDLETGVGLSGTSQGSDPQAMLRWSDDGGHTWSNEYWVAIGKIGKYRTRAKWNRLGSARDRVYEIRITDPVKVVLIGAEIEVEEGVA